MHFGRSTAERIISCDWSNREIVEAFDGDGTMDVAGARGGRLWSELRYAFVHLPSGHEPEVLLLTAERSSVRIGSPTIIEHHLLLLSSAAQREIICRLGSGPPIDISNSQHSLWVFLGSRLIAMQHLLY